MLNMLRRLHVRDWQRVTVRGKRSPFVMVVVVAMSGILLVRPNCDDDSLL